MQTFASRAASKRAAQVIVIMTKLFKSTLLAALFSLLISAAYAEQAPVSIRGKITEFRGYVMYGLTVTARDNSTGREYQAVSDDKGFFSFEGLEPGSYALESQCEGSQDMVGHASVKAGSTTEVELLSFP